MSTTDRLTIWKAYQAAWSAVDEAKRRELLAQSVAPEIVYTDPGSQTHGVDELSRRIAASQMQFPGATFRNDSFLEHHAQGLFNWTMFAGDGTVFATGSSFARFGNDGRLVQSDRLLRRAQQKLRVEQEADAQDKHFTLLRPSAPF